MRSKAFATINTVEELVLMAVTDSGYHRYILHQSTHEEFNDEAAGIAWYAQQQEYRDRWDSEVWNRDWSDPSRVAYREEGERLDAIKPATHQVVNWRLQTKDFDCIQLSNEVGEALNKIWKTRPLYNGSNSNVYSGYVTIKGIVLKLGHSEISQQIKDAKLAEAERIAKYNRNYARKQVRDAASRLNAAIEEAQAKGVSFAELNVVFKYAMGELITIADEPAE